MLSVKRNNGMVVAHTSSETMVLDNDRKKEICGAIVKAGGALLGRALASDEAAVEATWMQIRVMCGAKVPKAEREFIMETMGITIGMWNKLEKRFREAHPEFDPKHAAYNPEARKPRAARPLNALSAAMENNTNWWPSAAAQAFGDKARADYNFLCVMTRASNKGRPEGEKAKTKKDVRNYMTGNRLLMDRTPNSKARNPKAFQGKRGRPKP